jgi:glycosyltransferase involved in cell wall biosynthesis
MITLGTGTSLFLGRIGALVYGIPVIYSTLHTMQNLNTKGVKYFEYPNHLLNKLIPFLPGKRKVRFLPVCNKLATKMGTEVKNYPVQALYNGIPTKDLSRISNYEPSLKIQNFAEAISKCPTLIQVGSVDDNKNQAFTLERINDLRQHYPDVRLLIVGDGPNLIKLKSKAKLQDLMRHVIFTGKIRRLDCLYLMSKADILVLTSQTEALPNVLIEAQGLGIPVVSFKVGGADEIVVDGATGYIIEPNDAEQFNRKVNCLLTDKSLAAKMSKEAQQRINDKFDIEKKAQKFLSLINTDLNEMALKKK